MKRDPIFFAELEEELDKHFPKGKCKERGAALVVFAMANIIHSRRMAEEVEEAKSGDC